RFAVVFHRFLIIILGMVGAHWVTGQSDSLKHYFDEVLLQQSNRNDREAIELGTIAIDRFLSNSDNDSLNAQLHHRIGISHYRLRNRKAAIDFWNKALEIRNHFLPAHHIDIIKTHINIANAYLTLSDYRHSSLFLNRALELLHSQSEKDAHNLSRVYESLGLIANLTEDYQSSQEYLNQSYLLKRVMYKNEPWKLINITTRLFDTQRNLDHKVEMLNLANEVIGYAKSAPIDGDQYYFDLANAHNNLGIAYAANDDPTQAIGYFEKSLAINAKFSTRKDFLAFTHSNLIREYSIKGNGEKALFHCEMAKLFFESDSSYAIYLAETLIEEGDVYYSAENYEKAAKIYQRSLNTKVIDRKLMKISDNPNPDDLILGPRSTLMDALFKKAKCFYSLGKLDEANETFENLLAFVSLSQGQLSDRTSKRYLQASFKKFYELAIEIQYALFNQTRSPKYVDRALSLFDKSKAHILYEALWQNVITSEDDTLKYLIEKERSLYQSISDKKLRIYESDADVNELEEKDSIVLLRNQLANIRDTVLQVLSMRPYIIPSDQFYNLSDVQKNFVPKDGAIMQFFVGENNSYVIYIDKEHCDFQLLIERDLLYQRSNLFLKHLKDYGTKVDEYTTSAFDLYRSISMAQIDPKRIKNLIIIPDDILAYIPFEALTSDSISTGGYRSVKYVLENYSISYAASLSVLELQKNSASTAKRAFLGMSLDYKGFDPKAVTPLTHAVQELKQVNQMVDGDIYINKKATKTKFLEIQNRYRNIHLSLHAYISPENPSLSYLQFAAPFSENDEGKLYSSTVYQKSFDTDMMVLSACETGSGTLAKGEGILSLAHAFAYAGTRSTVMSLWEISSETTAKIITNFYEGIKNFQPKDRALQEAKMEYISSVKAPELAHPFYWSALVQYGDSKALDLTPNVGWFVLLLILFISAVCYWIFFRSADASSA
ncbi:MAG: CHAT domain-containing protein, partial [Saprospiraceae bacterium]|nr:CHAT domain-containing protein [Saprospiraceae bacterium]